MMLRNYFAVTLGSVSLASAFSLYDTAPVVGVPESRSATYSMSFKGGYDTNPQGTTDKRLKKAGYYVNAGLSTSFADVESVDKLSYSARLGGTHYLGSAAGQGRKYYADSSLDANLVHAFSAASRYSGRVHVSYMPEPGYDNGYSSAGMRGDTLSWSLDNTYSEAIDARWSWNAGLNYSGTRYENALYVDDNRQYYSVSGGLNYRESEILTYTSSLSYRDELRSAGMDSRSAFASLGVQYALSPVSSASFSSGVQCKMMNHQRTLNPTVDMGYRRRVTDGLSVNAYVKYSDENADNYSRYHGASYRSSPAWRVGAYGTYVLSPDVSYTFRMQAIQTRYRKPTDSKLPSSSRYTLNPSLSMNYNFSPDVTGLLSVDYTFYHYDRGNEASMYTRLQYSAGLSYRF